MNSWVQPLWFALTWIGATLSAGLAVRWVVRARVGRELSVPRAWGLAIAANALSFLVGGSLFAFWPAEPDSRRWLYGALLATLAAGAVQALWYGLAVRDPGDHTIGWRQGCLVAAAGLLLGTIGALPFVTAGLWIAIETSGV